MSIAAVMMGRERRLVERFRDAGATSPQSARPIETLDGADPRALDRLRRRAVIREAKPGAFHLDEPSWEALRGVRKRLMLVLLALVVFGVLAAVLPRR